MTDRSGGAWCSQEFEIGQHHPSVEKGWIGVIAADAQILDPEGGEPLVQAFGGRRPPIGKSLSAVAHMDHRRVAMPRSLRVRSSAGAIDLLTKNQKKGKYPHLTGIGKVSVTVAKRGKMWPKLATFGNAAVGPNFS
jgi:hypothetical protein